jgi:hypothetical protein
VQDAGRQHRQRAGSDLQQLHRRAGPRGLNKAEIARWERGLEFADVHLSPRSLCIRLHRSSYPGARLSAQHYARRTGLHAAVSEARGLSVSFAAVPRHRSRPHGQLALLPLQHFPAMVKRELMKEVAMEIAIHVPDDVATALPLG